MVRRALLPALVAAALLPIPATAGALDAGTLTPVAPIALPAGAIAGGPAGADVYDEAQPLAASRDGRYVVFLTNADALVGGADPDVSSLVRKDTTSGTVTLVSRATSATGAPAANGAFTGRMSSDGNRVAFTTTDPLSANDADQAADVYVREISTNRTYLATPGTASSVNDFDLSGDGETVVFSTDEAIAGTDANAERDVYRYRINSPAGTTPAAVSLNAAGNGFSAHPDATAPTVDETGRWIAWSSTGTDVVSGMTPGAPRQVYARRLSSPTDATSTAGTTYLVSSKQGSPGTGANGAAIAPQIARTVTSDNPTIAFDSTATDAATGDTSASSSVLVRTLSATSSSLASRAAGVAGASFTDSSFLAGVSDDGNQVLLTSGGAVVVRDTAPGTPTTTTVSPAGASDGATALAGDGNSVILRGAGLADGSDPLLPAVFKRSIDPLGAVTLVSRPAGDAPFRAPVVPFTTTGRGTVSVDGRYVVFTALPTGLPGGGDASRQAVYRRDLVTGTVVRVSPDGGPAGESAFDPAISADGNRVAFLAGSLTPDVPQDTTTAYVVDVAAQTTTVASRTNGGAVVPEGVGDVALSADGTHVAFVSRSPTLTPGSDTRHVYVRDLGAGTTTLADRATGADGAVAAKPAGFGTDGAPRLSADGKKVVFVTRVPLAPGDAGPTSFVYLRDLAGATTTLVSRGPGAAGTPVTGYGAEISGDGTTAAFYTLNPAVAPGIASGSQVILRDLTTQANVVASRRVGGPDATGTSSDPVLSADGRTVAFTTSYSGLVAGQDQDTGGIVVRAPDGTFTGPPSFGSRIGLGYVTSPALSADGRCVVFDARGHSPLTGAAGSFKQVSWVFAAQSGCGVPVSTGGGGGGGQTPGGGTPPPATLPGSILDRPVLSKVSLSRTTFAVGKQRTAVSAAKRRARTGTTIRFSLSTRSTVAFAITKPAKGRKVGKACRKPTRKLRKRKACTRQVAVATLVRKSLAPGARAVAFSGRVGKKALKPGRYRMTIVAANADGRSPARTIAFRIVKR